MNRTPQPAASASEDNAQHNPSAITDTERLDALAESLGGDFTLSLDGTHAFAAEDFVDFELWHNQGGNCDAPEFKRAFRDAIDAAIQQERTKEQ